VFKTFLFFLFFRLYPIWTTICLKMEVLLTSQLTVENVSWCFISHESTVLYLVNLLFYVLYDLDVSFVCVCVTK